MFTIEEARKYVEDHRAQIDNHIQRILVARRIEDTPHVRAAFASGYWLGHTLEGLGQCPLFITGKMLNHGTRCARVPDIDPYVLAVSTANQVATAITRGQARHQFRYLPSTN